MNKSTRRELFTKDGPATLRRLFKRCYFIASIISIFVSFLVFCLAFLGVFQAQVPHSILEKVLFSTFLSLATLFTALPLSWFVVTVWISQDVALARQEKQRGENHAQC